MASYCSTLPKLGQKLHAIIFFSFFEMLGVKKLFNKIVQKSVEKRRKSDLTART
jgi:hypothetical protein